MRRTLTYHKLPFKRIIILFVIVIGSILTLKILPVSQAGATFFEKFLAFIFFFGSLLIPFSIYDLLRMRLQKRKIEFDDVNMYIIRNGRESVIPLKNINEISITGAYSAPYGWPEYRIYFTDKFNEMVYVNSWFIKPTGEIGFFKSNVQKQNPSVEIKDFGMWIGLFFKKLKY
ncbi:MAG: hypothetical protein ABUT20_09050 [Bacteroidota bacterium]